MEENQMMISKDDENDDSFENAVQSLNRLNEELDGLQASLSLALSAMCCTEETYQSDVYWEVAAMISFAGHQMNRLVSEYEDISCWLMSKCDEA